jgi:opacity protein-like surface antigen
MSRSMGSSKALFFAAAVALGFAQSASAADLLPPPPMPIPVAAPLDTSGWYIRADVGVGVNDFSSMRSTLAPTNPLGGPAPAIARVFTTIGDSGLFGIGVGYQINNWFRADMTGEYRSSANYHASNTYSAFCPVAFCLDSYNAQWSQALFMANGYVDLGTWYGVTPFVGAGVGAAFNRFSALTDAGAGFGYANSNKNTNFAWAVMAGLGYSVTQNLKLEFSYRYLNTGSFTSNPILCGDIASCFFETHSFKAASHDLRIGMRWMFADYTPPVYAPPPGPLVRKY